MSSKPFKPLTIHRTSYNRQSSHGEISEPPSKKRKISPAKVPKNNEQTPDVISTTSRTFVSYTNPTPPRKPLQPLLNIPSPPEQKLEASKPGVRCYYSVLWRNVTNKKNKTWTGDGVLAVVDGCAILHDSSGRCIGRLPFSKPLLPGSPLSLAGKEVEVDNCIGKDEYQRVVKATPRELDEKPSRPSTKENLSVPTAKDIPKPKMTLQEQMRLAMQKEKEAGKTTSSKVTHSAAPIKTAAFKQPLKENNVLTPGSGETPVPRHDPLASGAVVFKRPSTVPTGKQLVDVVLDPLLAKNMRPHQIEGVQFLYECVMELRDFGGQGCILADDMGLGKTLQTIALLWTLIKQNPVYRAAPVVRKALIVCPVSLIKNWKKEFKKWLGSDRLGVLEFEDPKTTRLSMFDGKIFNVMIIGYERLRMVADDLAEAHGIDIVICDEGHRLKTVKNKSAKAIESLNTPRRVILSGTPIQNDLGEFYAMVNFVNDGALGSAKAFIKDFEQPIMKSRQPNASEEDVELGETASEELARTTSPFILRRTAEILSDFLPPKTEYVLFCKPTPEQATIYRSVVNSPMFRHALGNTDTALQLITILKKLCNSPALMQPKTNSDEPSKTDSLIALNEMLPSSMSRYYHNSLSAKIRLLDVLLQQIRSTTNEKVVLVSNYTSTLDLMENLLSNSGLTYLRLDGTVPAGKRQSLVDEFNRARPTLAFAFLLSAKAGGVGINLIGASRLVLFDVDWNPATDDQAMARIYRQGQKHQCRIYRFLIKGGLEERIWQRQVVKRGLAESIMDGKNTNSGGGDSLSGKKGKATFSQEELRDLFRFDESEGLRTHDLIECGCKGSGRSIDHEPDGPDARIKPFWEETSGQSDRPSSEELPDLPSIVHQKQRANAELDIEDHNTSRTSKATHKQDKKKESKELQELMQYVHLDTTAVSKMSEDGKEIARITRIVDDACLMHLLQQKSDVIAGGVSFVFKKTSGMKAVSNGGGEAVEVKKEELKSGFFV